MYKNVFPLHAKLLKAIAHPKRLEIIHLLRAQPLSVQKIQSMLGIRQANVSQHLQILRKAGVVKTDRDGKWVVYMLAHPNFLVASDAIREVLIEKYKGSAMAKAAARALKRTDPILYDPVCGMRVTPATAGASLHQNGTMYFFCATGCLRAFTRSPKKYAKH